MSKEIMIPAWVDGALAPIEKLSAHRQGLRHKAVSVFVLCGSKTLLQRRAMHKYHSPGQWANACCTHPQWDERPEACGKRRLEEELGLTGLALSYRGVVEYRADVGNGMVEHEVVDIFTAEMLETVPVDPNPEEVMATTWMPIGTLQEDLATRPGRYAAWLRIYMAEYADKILSREPVLV